jgi:hypothetical protein
VRGENSEPDKCPPVGIGAALGTLARAADRYRCAAVSHTARPHRRRALFLLSPRLSDVDRRACRWWYSHQSQPAARPLRRPAWPRHRGVPRGSDGGFASAKTARCYRARQSPNFASNVGSLIFFVLRQRRGAAGRHGSRAGIGGGLERGLCWRKGEAVRPLVVLAALGITVRLSSATLGNQTADGSTAVPGSRGAQ